MALGRTIARRVRSGLKRRAKSVLVKTGLRDPDPVPEPVAAPAPVPAAPAPVAAAVPEPAPANVGFTQADVEELFDDMVRPALQADGGDITLVRVDGGDIFVELVGACSTCPSATATMRMGIERLLEEELEGFRSLIEVNGVGGLSGHA